MFFCYLGLMLHPPVQNHLYPELNPEIAIVGLDEMPFPSFFKKNQSLY